jgi:gluconolactonase
MIRERWEYGCALFVAALCGCSSSSATSYGGGSGAGGAGASSSSGTGSPSDEGGGASGSPSSGSVGPSGSSASGASSDDGGTTANNPDATTGGGDGGNPPGKDSGTGPVTYPPLKFSSIGQATKISGQFYFTEGPVWDPSKNVLYFTDINAHQGNTTGGAVYKLTLPSTIEILFQPDGTADGLGLDPQGNIIAAGYGARNIWRLAAGNTMTTLAPCSSGPGTCYNGQEINTPDDIAARSDGVIYFTDPTFGQSMATGTFGLSGAQGVYRLTTDGKLHLEDSSTSGPNGVNFSPDEKTLYVAYTSTSSVSKFTVAADGSLSNKTTFASATFADSMCVDAGGNVYVATSSGLAVFSPAGGAALGTISCGGDTVTNCAFGGPDQKTLFITSHAGAPGSVAAMGTSSLYKVDNMPVPGTPGQN